MKNKEKTSAWWRPGIILFSKVSAYIAIPIILALYIGKFLDNKYDTTPWIFLILTFVSFLISLISIWNFISKYIDKIEKEERKKIIYDTNTKNK